MASPSNARTIGVRGVAVVAATGLPILMRSGLDALVAGPITAGHVLLAQGLFLALAGHGAILAARATRRASQPWRSWAVDAASLAGAAALINGAQVAAGPRHRMALDLDVVTLVVSAPIVEEIVYRGLLPGLLTPPGNAAPGLARRTGIAVLSSAAFAAGHVGAVGYSGAGTARSVAISFGCGLAFHLLRGASGRLAASMAAHAGVNATNLCAMG
jgi:membrane protease YdiL (CAAX protease family)